MGRLGLDRTVGHGGCQDLFADQFFSGFVYGLLEIGLLHPMRLRRFVSDLVWVPANGLGQMFIHRLAEDPFAPALTDLEIGGQGKKKFDQFVRQKGEPAFYSEMHGVSVGIAQ